MSEVMVPDGIELLPLGELVPYARNSRTHSSGQVAQLAASMREFGFTNPVLVDATGGIIAGHGRVMAAQSLGMSAVPCVRLGHLTEAQRRAYVIADNQLALNAGWDVDALRAEVEALQVVGFDLDLLGFDGDSLEDLIGPLDSDPASDGSDQAAAADSVLPEVREHVVSRPGDVWVCGSHRVMCGSSTDPVDVAVLMAGQEAQLLHADPPYGMGKAADGVANDNLYREKLDAFQLDWWRAFRPHLVSNGCAFVWGNAPDLWRLWYAAGLSDVEVLELRNEIVWDKVNIPGMASPGLTQFPVASERCLFFQFGKQFLGNVNTDDFPESWEPLRGYLAGEADAAGIRPADVQQVCGVGMYSHWFTRAQFTLVPEARYRQLQAAYPAQFLRPWAELKAEWAKVRGGARDVINMRQSVARSYFDNAHDAMTDVWRFPRVIGDDRYGHATPKPVAMMVRAIKSACPEGGIVAEPFGGSGSTLMGADACGRACYTMELQAHYVDVIVRRWQQVTGGSAVLAATGESFAKREGGNE